MTENPIMISHLNDFIFCPASIYFHGLDIDADRMLYQTTDQINGTAAHEKIDNKKYTHRKNILQSIFVYSEKYGLYGKIDLFDITTGVLTERKKKISSIYDGYKFQLYAQHYALIEMGYNVRKLQMHSFDDNKTYSIALPQAGSIETVKFESLLDKMRNFSLDTFQQNSKAKCVKCIYEPLQIRRFAGIFFRAIKRSKSLTHY